MIIYPDSWPTEVRDAYDAACAAGDTERQAETIEAQTGEWPRFPQAGVGMRRDLHVPQIIEIRVRSDGPQ